MFAAELVEVVLVDVAIIDVLTELVLVVVEVVVAVVGLELVAAWIASTNQNADSPPPERTQLPVTAFVCGDEYVL